MSGRGAWLLLLTACVGDDVATDAPDTLVDSEAVGDTDPSTTSADRPHPAHRLSLVELRRSIHDVLGVDVDVAGTLPPDGRLHGFDHADEATVLTDAFVERWADLVLDVVDLSLADDVRLPASTPVATVGAEALPWDDGAVGAPWLTDAAWWVLQGAGSTSVDFEAPEGGPWTLDLAAVIAPAEGVRMRVRVWVDGALLLDEARTTWPSAGEAAPREHLPLGTIEPGPHTLALQVDTTAPVTWPWPPEHGGLQVPGRPFLAVDALELTGPTTPERPDPAPPRDGLITCTPDDEAPEPCLAQILWPVTRRLWRRDPTTAELDRLVRLADDVRVESGDLDEGVGAALQAVLLSPSFLYRLDVDRDAVDADGRPLRAYALATRLSFAVWGLPPDDVLLDCAAADQLRADAHPCGLPAQLDRLLAVPRADALVDRFLEGWLDLTGFDQVTVDSMKQPLWSDDLAAAMRDEVRGLGREVLLGDRDLHDLLDAEHAWLRFPLGSLYGETVLGWTPEPVDVDPAERAGLLAAAKVLTASSLAGSPVQRGAWLTRSLLCTEPPKPPPGIPPAPQLQPGQDPNEVFDQHLADPACKGCHQTFEPYGRVLALYGQIGERRVDADGVPLTVETTLPTGEVVHDVGELAAALRADPRFDACAVQRLLLWTFGAEVASAEQVEALRARADADGFTLRALLHAVVADPSFQETSP